MQTVQGRVKREGIMLYSMSRDVHMLLVVLKTRAHKGHKVANEVIFGHKKAANDRLIHSLCRRCSFLQSLP